MKMPWGKHKDEDIEDLPSGYLEWLAGTLDEEKHGPVCLAADREYQRRLKAGEAE